MSWPTSSAVLALAFFSATALAGPPAPTQTAAAMPTAETIDQPPTPADEADAVTPPVTSPADPFTGPLPEVDSETFSPAVELERGRVLLRLGQPNAAAQSFRRILVAHPTHVAALEGLKQAAIAAERVELLPELLVRLCDTYLGARDLELVGRRLRDLATLAPGHPELARLEEALGRRPLDGEMNTPLTTRLRSLLGIIVLLGLAFAVSVNRRQIPWRTVGWGLGLQLIFALIILKTRPGLWLFEGARVVVDRVLRFTDEGAGFLFGNLYNGVAAGATRGPAQFLDGTSGDYLNIGVVFAFHVLPTIIFIGALMSVLYHLRLLQRVVRGVAWVMTRTMRTSGSESLSCAANIFVGQTEAPLVVRPYLERMTMSELMAVMTGGFATVSGGVLMAYARFGIDPGHLLAASVMNAPAALVMAKLMFPETELSETRGGQVIDPKPETANVIDAAAAGASDGLKLALNVAGMLIAFIALIALFNWGLGLVGGLFGQPELSLKVIFGLLFYPISWCMGAESQDLWTFGHLLGTKISLNEFVAYVDLGHMLGELQPRTAVLATYALCGFANFSSIGIQIGGISALAPSRRSDLARLGLRAMFAGTFASWITACVAGILL